MDHVCQICEVSILNLSLTYQVHVIDQPDVIDTTLAVLVQHDRQEFTQSLQVPFMCSISTSTDFTFEILVVETCI